MGVVWTGASRVDPVDPRVQLECVQLPYPIVQQFVDCVFLW